MLITASMLITTCVSASSLHIRKDNNGNCFIPEQAQYEALDVFVSFGNTPYCRFSVSPLTSKGYPPFVSFNLVKLGIPTDMIITISTTKGDVVFNCNQHKIISTPLPISTTLRYLRELVRQHQLPSYCLHTPID
jgi:hypothetical protein